MKVGILTAPRKDSGFKYLIETIESMTTTAVGPIEVHAFVDDHYVPAELHQVLPDVHFHWHETSVPLLFRDRPRHYLGTPNYLSMLSYLAKHEDLCFAFEDDIKFAKNWDARALELCGRAAEFYDPGRYVFSMIHFYDVEEFYGVGKTRFGDELLRPKLQEDYYGTQGIVMPSNFVCEMISGYPADWSSIPVKAFQDYWVPDMRIKATAKQMDIPILSSNPCLIQHVGHSSSIIEDRTGKLETRYFSDD